MSDGGDTQIRTEARAAADETQRRLVADAVCEIIASEGMEAATLRRTASALGCTTGLISHYFESKEALLFHALRHATRQLSDGLQIHRPSTIDEHLRAFCDALPLDPDRMRFWRVLSAFRGAALTNEPLRIHFEGYDRVRSAHLRQLLAAEVDREPDDEVVTDLDRALNALLEGFGLVATERPDLYTPDNVYPVVAVALRAWIGASTD